MPARRIAAIVSPVLTFVRWLFSELAPGVDVFLGLLGTAWLGLMLTHAEIFERGNLQGMSWMPDKAWIAFVALTVALHFAGLARPTAITLRVCSQLLTSWYWLLISISLARTGLSTGPFTYALIGAASLVAAIYVSGHGKRAA